MAEIDLSKYTEEEKDYIAKKLREIPVAKTPVEEQRQLQTEPQTQQSYPVEDLGDQEKIKFNLPVGQKLTGLAEAALRGADVGGVLSETKNKVIAAIDSGSIDPDDPEFQDALQRARANAEYRKEAVLGTTPVEMLTSISPISGPGKVFGAVGKGINAISKVLPAAKNIEKLSPLVRTGIETAKGAATAGILGGATKLASPYTGINPEDVDIVGDAKYAAVLSGFFGGLMNIGPGLAKTLKGKEAEYAVKSFGAMIPEYKKVAKGARAGTGPTMGEVGKYIVENDLNKSTPERRVEVLKDHLENIEETLRDKLTRAQQSITWKPGTSTKGMVRVYNKPNGGFSMMNKEAVFDLRKKGQEILDILDGKAPSPYTGEPINLSEKEREIAKEVIQRGLMDKGVAPLMAPKTLSDYKRQWRKNVNAAIYDKTKLPSEQEAVRVVDHILTRGLEDTVDRASKVAGEQFGDIRKLNKAYQKAIIANDIAEIGYARAKGRREIGLSEQLVGIPLAIATGSGLIGLIGGAMANLVKKQGGYVASKLARGASQLVESTPSKIGPFKQDLISSYKVGGPAVAMKMNEIMAEPEWQYIDPSLKFKYEMKIRDLKLPKSQEAKALKNIRTESRIDSKYYDLIEQGY